MRTQALDPLLDVDFLFQSLLKKFSRRERSTSSLVDDLAALVKQVLLSRNCTPTVVWLTGIISQRKQATGYWSLKQT